MTNCILSVFSLAIVLFVARGYAQRCSPQQCAALLDDLSRRFPRGEQIEAVVCEDSRPRRFQTHYEQTPNHSNYAFSRGSNKLAKEARNAVRDWNKEKNSRDWERPAAPAPPAPSAPPAARATAAAAAVGSGREEEFFEETNKDSYEEEIQFEESVPIYDAERMNMFPKSFDASDSAPFSVFNLNKDSSRFQDRISSLLDKDNRRNSDSLRQRSFALSPNPSQRRQTKRSGQ